jgi:heme exporter protein A
MLAAHQLAYERHFRPVFTPVDVTLEAGNLLLVTGANGSGKTTLLRLLAGVLRPSGGRIDNRATATAWLGHQLALKDYLTVRENLRFAKSFAGGAVDVEKAIRRVGLAGAASQLARSLSAGQRKRCALARLLLSDAPLWLLDEPYSNLDHAGVALVDTLLGEHLAAGGACVLSTHGELRKVGADVTELALSPGQSTG